MQMNIMATSAVIQCQKTPSKDHVSIFIGTFSGSNVCFYAHMFLMLSTLDPLYFLSLHIQCERKCDFVVLMTHRNVLVSHQN